jgi:hypothetical protein
MVAHGPNLALPLGAPCCLWPPIFPPQIVAPFASKFLLCVEICQPTPATQTVKINKNEMELGKNGGGTVMCNI